ncbi:carboxylesterase family protein [Deinococcus sp. Arct2-2]|uniref:carboxylesterase/lipase family protein n=1 Tax=Deinococcus sp. Arct2-2 TaxID=2568653 RepID=UPI0010A31AF2|nr:carboxylesterase/lipase family protein [Deinococcus sp. Arct2-2]THF71634.1 carboxylesterase family protein [Deinococcus sp. Arct2-2]
MLRTAFSRLTATTVLLLCAAQAQTPATQTPTTQIPVTVQTDQGAVIGRQADANSFLGIPYAAPPVGSLRWQPPQAAPTWTAPRDASQPGSVCPQVALGLFPVAGVTPGEVQGNEDCLFLNVYTPRSATVDRRLPVMVWLHGGSFTLGSGSAYDGSVMAEKYGVVVVTLNYRLGALGFLSLPALNTEAADQTSGNYGLLDQQAALRWVGRNVAGFGGNPSDVTIFGESAGGMSVCAQLASPQAAGLFQKAIIQSGLCFSPGNTVTLAQASGRNVRYADKLACRPTDLTCLRQVAPETLLKTTVPGLRPASNLVWSPVYGAGILPLTLQDAYAQGRFNRVPVLAGTNHDEGRLFVSAVSPQGKPVSVIQYWGGSGLLAGAANLGRVLAQYPVRSYSTPALAFATLFTDAVFSCPAVRVGTALSQYVPVYAFEFSDPQAATSIKAPADLPGLGSAHSSGLIYAFQTPIEGLGSPQQFSPEQATLSNHLSEAWATFAKTGKPTVTGQPEWAPFDPARANVQVFTPTGVQESTAFAADHKCEFWTRLNLN